MTSDSNVPLTFTDDILPVLWIHRLLTVAPISIEKGRVYFSWRSWPMAWAVTSFFLMSVYAIYVLRIKYADMQIESRTFSDAVYFCTFLLQLHHHFVSPVFHWPEAQGFAEYLQRWNDFQIEFKKVTGSPLHLGLRRHSWIHFTLIFGVPALLCVILCIYLKPVGYDELLPFISSGMFHALVPRTWNMFEIAVVHAAESLQENFDAMLAQGKGDSEKTRILKDFRRLWTKLRNLSAAPGVFWGRTSIHFILYCLLTLLMSAFGFMTGLQQGSISNRGKALACLVVDNLAHALTLCTAGYSSSNKVNSMRRKLLELKLKLSCGAALKEEVDTFLRVIQYSPSNVCLSGFVTLDRALFISMVSVVATYLCVLAQLGDTVNQLYT